MPGTAKLKASNHGQHLADYLKHSLESVATDLVIKCSDGAVNLHKVVLAARLVSPAFIRSLKANVEDDVVQILIPEATKASLEHLVQLLYFSRTEPLVQEDVKGLNEISDLLKISSLSLNVEEDPEFIPEEFKEPPCNQVSVQIVERKKATRKLPASILQEDPNSIRRSKRAKVKTKKLDDFETALKPAAAAVSVNEPKSKYNQESIVVTKERRIANVLVKVEDPKEEALEVQTEKSSLPESVVRICLICGKRLIGKFAFSHHLKRKHGRGSFPCRFCAQVFASGLKLHEHARLKRHNDTSAGTQKYKKTTYTCDLQSCQQASFATFNAFKGHCLEVHDVFPLECGLCKKRYKEQATFKNHMETHSGVLKYECDVCGKKFVTRERLFAHRRLHLGELLDS